MKDIKPDFSYTAHKLITRISAIYGYAQGLERGIITPEKASSTIQKECESLKEELDSMLTAVLLDFQQCQYEPEPVPLIEVMANCIDRSNAMGINKGLTLTVKQCADEIYVLGNEDLIEDILDNLFSNVIRYAKTSVFITVRTGGENVLLTVEDDGPGIHEEDLPYIFDRLYTGPNGNTGLGLYIAHKATLQMGGTLTAANRPEGGAIFTLELKKDSSR